MIDSSDTIVGFYRGAGRDHRGRSLDEILSWNDDTLEGVHDYIQWLFPLDEPSAFNPGAPMVTSAVREAFRADPRLSAQLRRAFIRMLVFYGFQPTDQGIERSRTWTERSGVWLTPRNHNYLRLTRIMKSLILLGQPELAQGLRSALMAEYDRSPDRIGTTTIRFWKAAAE